MRMVNPIGANAAAPGRRAELTPVGYETLQWKNDPDALASIPKSRRRRLASTYEAAIPASIASVGVDLDPSLHERMGSVMADLARFDEQQATRGYDLPALLLRSESSASSQIEHLTSSVRNVAWAELSDSAPMNARIVSGNIAAMRRALALPDAITVEGILAVHHALIEPSGQSFGGILRDEQVWVGGTPYSPHEALYVPPAPGRVQACLDDLIAYAARDDVEAIVKAAVVHAQFETIHPFIDGNGRTGRTLLHKVLRREGLLGHTTLPVSAGLLHDVDTYMDAIARYQAGDPQPVIACLLDALELAISVGGAVARRIDAVVDGWRDGMNERKGSAILRLPDVLVAQPVVNTEYLARELDITQRAAANLAGRACAYGILRQIGNVRRGMFYQADEIVDVLEEASSVPGIRRMLAGGSGA